jgi:AraC family transcriptional regulator
VSDLVLNPDPAQLGRVNGILSARARQYWMRPFAGPLSIKTVVRGSAAWQTSSSRFVVEPGIALVLNDGEEYATEVDSPHPVETFCVFFARGYVEDAAHAAATSSAALLDGGAPAAVDFVERMQFDQRLLFKVTALRQEPSEARLASLATHLVSLRRDITARVAALPATRATTREELARRIGVATEFIHANMATRLLLSDIASAAAMSPFHLHRIFSSIHGMTPHAYIARLRFERACALLRNSSLPILEIASSCGFESVGSFTTTFTRRLGVPPARFRKNGEDAMRSLALSSAHD